MKIAFSEDIVSVDVAGEAMILNTETELYFGLDPVGLRFFESLKKHGATAPVVR